MTPIDLVKLKRAHAERLANERGAAGESAALAVMDAWLPRPRGRELKTLLDALANRGIAIKGSSFDAIWIPSGAPLDLTNASVTALVIDQVEFIEIKTCNQARVRQGFAGFFFALTEAEIRAADVLGARHRVALYHRRTGDLLLTSVPEILARAKSTNWQVSVQL